MAILRWAQSLMLCENPGTWIFWGLIREIPASELGIFRWWLVRGQEPQQVEQWLKEVHQPPGHLRWEVKHAVRKVRVESWTWSLGGKEIMNLKGSGSLETWSFFWKGAPNLSSEVILRHSLIQHSDLVRLASASQKSRRKGLEAWADSWPRYRIIGDPKRRGLGPLLLWWWKIQRSFRNKICASRRQRSRCPGIFARSGALWMRISYEFGVIPGEFLSANIHFDRIFKVQLQNGTPNRWVS